MLTLCCDVGTGSVRVSIFEFDDRNNQLDPKAISISIQPLTIYNRKKYYYEQKTSEIWNAFCLAAKDCCKQLESNQTIDSIGFTATCSLVIVSDDDNDFNSSNNYDVIMWMDHRAVNEAKLINQTGHNVLEQFGNICSPEFSLSKLIWLHNNESKRFQNAKAFMELPDWLSHRCSDVWSNENNFKNFSRSLCSVVCKWGYDSENQRWPSDLFEKLGIKFDGSMHEKIGTKIIPSGLMIGHMSKKIAHEIGIPIINEPIKISCPLIDAHAGAISMLMFSKSLNLSKSFDNVLCMIAGTSTCHMLLNRNRIKTKGIWGPYLNAIIPGYYLREAGQSASGALVEHIIRQRTSDDKNNFKNVIKKLNHELSTKNNIHKNSLIINPSFHGNRSPIADPNLRGAIYGLTLENESLLEIYSATIEAIAYETKFIVEEIEHDGQTIQQIVVSGGLTKNEFYLQTHADILGRKIFVYDLNNADHMLTGAAIMSYLAYKNQSNSLEELISLLDGVKIKPSDSIIVRCFEPRSEIIDYHHKKYQCYHKLLKCSIEIESILSS